MFKKIKAWAFIILSFLLLLILINKTTWASLCYVPEDCKTIKCPRECSWYFPDDYFAYNKIEELKNWIDNNELYSYIENGKCICTDRDVTQSSKDQKLSILSLVKSVEEKGRISNPVLDPSVGSGDAGEKTMAKILSAIINLFFIAGSIAVIVYILLGGLAWITSEGDKGKMETAKNRLMHAIMGIIVIAATYIIINILGTFLGIDFFKDGLKIIWPTITSTNGL